MHEQQQQYDQRCNELPYYRTTNDHAQSTLHTLAICPITSLTMSPLQVISGLNTHLPHTHLLLQDPAAAEKLTKISIQKDLDETTVILHQTIDSVLRRGEKLDTLVEKSADLSLASKMFAKQARKTNSCCRMS
jgi:hypothetical protein